ncbi:hypothetical protein BGZ81_003582 [Podila clonocystis]|nr:hypothetical protein BGZ81_003582 [Podila clonocystis]
MILNTEIGVNEKSIAQVLVAEVVEIVSEDLEGLYSLIKIFGCLSILHSGLSSVKSVLCFGRSNTECLKTMCPAIAPYLHGAIDKVLDFFSSLQSQVICLYRC